MSRQVRNCKQAAITPPLYYPTLMQQAIQVSVHAGIGVLPGLSAEIVFFPKMGQWIKVTFAQGHCPALCCSDRDCEETSQRSAWGANMGGASSSIPSSCTASATKGVPKGPGWPWHSDGKYPSEVVRPWARSYRCTKGWIATLWV